MATPGPYSSLGTWDARALSGHGQRRSAGPLRLSARPQPDGSADELTPTNASSFLRVRQGGEVEAARELAAAWGQGAGASGSHRRDKQEALERVPSALAPTPHLCRWEPQE